MSNLLFLSFFILFSFPATRQTIAPDFSKKEDLKFLGTGKIIQQDGSVIKNIHLLEIDSYWIIYEKNSSSHDMMMDVISRIEFSDTKWGPLYLVFPNNKTESRRLNNYN